MTKVCVFFFFQADDGIRDADVTGVQTCALPISRRHRLLRVQRLAEFGGLALRVVAGGGETVIETLDAVALAFRRGEAGLQLRDLVVERELAELFQIGRASCRERV